MRDLFAVLTLLTNDRHWLRRRAWVAVDERHAVASVALRDLRVSAHTAVHHHHRAPAGLRLNPDDPMERDSGTRTDRAARLDRDGWAGKTLGSARRIKRIVDEVSQLVEIQLGVAGHIRNTLSATDVQFGEQYPMMGAKSAIIGTI